MSAARQHTHNNSHRIKVEPPELYNQYLANQTHFFNEAQNVFRMQQQAELQNYALHYYSYLLQQNNRQNNNG